MTGTGIALVTLQSGEVGARAHRSSLPDFSAPVRGAHPTSAPAAAHPAPAPSPLVSQAATAAAPGQVASGSTADSAPAPRRDFFAQFVAPSVVDADVDAAPLDHQLTQQREEAHAAARGAVPVVHRPAHIVLVSKPIPNLPPAQPARASVPAAPAAPDAEPTAAP